MVNCSRLRCFIKLPTEDVQLDKYTPPVVATTVTLHPSTQAPEAEKVKSNVSHVDESTGGTVDAPEVVVIEVSTTTQATKVDEETAKQVLGDVVTGKGYAPYHKQALMAMAKGSHPGGEAQRAALIDLRTASLLEKLEEQTSLARGYWDIVNACKGLCNTT